jgi:hypothetical protein
MSDTAIEPAAAPVAETVSAPVETSAPIAAAPETAESQPTATSADNSAAPVFNAGNVQDFILKGFEAIESPEQSAAETQAAAEPAAPAVETKEASEVVTESQPEKVSEPVKEPEKPVEAEKPAETVTEEVEAETKEPTLSDYFDNIGKTEILTREQIDAQFARAPKAIRDVAANYAELAQKGQEVVEKIGGEHFLEPLSQIADGIRKGENFGVFQGVLSAVGVDGFTDLLEDAMRVAVIETQSGQPKSDGEKYLQDRCKALVNGVLEARFGTGASLDRLEKLFKYDAQGLLNTSDIESYLTESESEPNPVIEQQKAEIETLRRQLEENKSQETEKKTQAERAQRDEFDKQANASLDKVLNDFVLTKSILRPIDNDSEPVSQGKKAAETLLKSYIQQQMKANPKYAELQKSFQKGEQNTAVYRNAYSSLLDTAMFNAREVASGIEAVFSQLYQNSRNQRLSESLEITTPTEQEQQPIAQPTETTKPLNKAAMTTEQWRAHLAQQLAQS